MTGLEKALQRMWAPVLLCELSDVSITAVERMDRCRNVTPWSTGSSACRR